MEEFLFMVRGVGVLERRREEEVFRSGWLEGWGSGGRELRMGMLRSWLFEEERGGGMEDAGGRRGKRAAFRYSLPRGDSSACTYKQTTLVWTLCHDEYRILRTEY